MPAVPRISFVVDCGAEVGWGHFIRSNALAAELRALRHEVDLFVNGPLPPFAQPRDGRATGLPCGSARLPPGVATPDAIVLDLRTYVPETAVALPGSAMVVVLVDGPDPPFPADLTVDGNVSSDGTGHDARLAGRAFVILRAGFDRAAVRETRAVETLLISFGGTERSAMLSQVLDAVDASPFGRIVVVAPSMSAALAKAPASRPTVSLHSSVSDMPALLREMDAALIAAGTLLHEACATGLPCAAISLSPEQHLEAQSIGKRGGTLYLGQAENVGIDDIAGAVIRLGHAETRAQLSAAAHVLVDGQGRRRVAEEIVARLHARERPAGR